MRQRNKIIASAIVVIVLLGGWFGLSRIRSARTDQPEKGTYRVERGAVKSVVSASGVIEPLTTVDVKSNAGGRVDLLAVDVGDEVEPGQLIAKIDPTDSQTAYRQATADLSAADAKLSQSKESLRLQSEQSRSQIRQAEEALRAVRVRLTQAESQAKAQPALTSSAIRQAEANYRSAQENLRQLKEAGVPQGISEAKASYDSANAALEKAQRNVERQRNLFAKGFISASQLDSAELEYRTAAAQAESAKKRLDTIDQDYDAQLRAAEARLEQASAALENAKANAVQDTIQEQAVLAARAAVKQAEAELALAQSNARQITMKEADIRTAQAQVVRSEAEVENARTQLEYTTITAPRRGVILRKYVEEGSIITSGRSSFAGTGEGTSIVQLGDLSRVFVNASVDETDIARVTLGQTVDITLDAYPDEKFEGTVTRIDPQTVVEQNVTTVPVTVEILNPDARLKPGMNATCDFLVDYRKNVLRLPSQLVRDMGEGKYVVTLLKGKEETEKTVEVGVIGDEYTEIVSGLKEGDVVTSASTSANATQGGRPSGGGRPPGPMPPMGMPRR